MASEKNFVPAVGASLPSGFQTAQFTLAASPSGTDPATGQPYYNAGVGVPNTGGVSVKTGSYPATAADCGAILSFNSATAVTLTLPASIPFAQWNIGVQNVGAGTLTISPNGLDIDGESGSLSVLTSSGMSIATDGTNYFTERGIGPSGAAGGDLGGSYPNPTVNQIEGAAIPASAAFVGTNSSKQLIAATAVTAVTGNAPITSTGGTTPAISVGTATTSALGVVQPDGSTIVISGGVISAAASSILFYGDASATCLGGEGVVTLGSTPIAGSVTLLLNGIALNTSLYTLSGAVATFLSNAFGVNDVVRAKWSTTNSTPGSITVTGSGNILHSYSASSNSGGVSSNIQPTLPAAASAGDFAVMCIGSSNGSLPSTPSGWTLVDGTSGSGTFWGGGTYTKTLTSGDIATGSVSFSTTGLWNACVVTFSGTVSVSTFISSRAGSTPISLTTPGSAVAGNTAIYFGSQGATPGGSTGAVTWNRGTSRSTANDGATNACAVYTETIATSTAGTVTSVVSYASPTAAHNFQTIVVVSTNMAPGTIPEISQSQISGFPAVADTGTANAYAVATSPVFGLVKGAFISFIAGNANTGASTLAVNGGTAIAIKSNGNTTALVSGSISAGQVIDVTYDGSVWQMTTPGAGAVTSLTTSGTSGAATLSAGVLNIPVYSGGGGGGASNFVLLAEYTASNSAELDFVTRNATGQSGAMFQSDYDIYQIEIIDLIPVTNGVSVYQQFTANGGSSYDTGANYEWGRSYYSTSSNDSGGYSQTSSAIGLQWWNADLYNGTGSISGLVGWGKLYAPLSTTNYKSMIWESFGPNTVPNTYMIRWAGRYHSTAAQNGCRFIMSSGNIASGTIRIYGLSH